MNRHVEWAKPEPGYKGTYDHSTSETVEVGADGYVDFEIPAGVVNGIYRLTVSTESATSYQVEIHDKAVRSDDNLVFRSESTVGDYNSVVSRVGLILQVDKDGESKIYGRVTGNAGETYVLNFNLARWI